MQASLPYDDEWYAGATDFAAPSALDCRPKGSILLPLTFLWVLLVINSWLGLFPVAEGLFFGVVLIAVMWDIRNVAVVALLCFYGPLQFRVWRPFVLTFALLMLAAFARGKMSMFWQALQRPFLLIATLFTSFCILTILISPDKAVAFGYTMQHIESVAFIMLIAAFLDSDEDIIVVLKVMAFLAGAALVISIIHAAFREQMWMTHVFRSLYRSRAEGKLSLVEGGTVHAARLVWAGLEANYWGARLIFPLGIAAGFVGASRSASSRAFWLVIASMILFGIFGSFSRGCFLAVVLVGIVFLLRNRMRGAIPAIVLLVLALVALEFMPYLYERYASIPESIAKRGGSGRLRLWAQSLKLWIESPIWGHGIGSVPVKTGFATHNTYLELLAETGLLGFSLYMWLLVSGLWAWARSVRLAKMIGDRRLRWLAEGGLIGTLGMMFAIATISAADARFAWMPPVIGLVFWSRIKMAAYDQEFLSYQEPVPGGLETPFAEA